jgi:hypothetical protein
VEKHLNGEGLGLLFVVAKLLLPRCAALIEENYKMVCVCVWMFVCVWMLIEENYKLVWLCVCVCVDVCVCVCMCVCVCVCV